MAGGRQVYAKTRAVPRPFHVLFAAVSAQSAEEANMEGTLFRAVRTPYRGPNCTSV